jgi:hypothetical protein
VAFRYRPWDAALGLGLFVLGVILALVWLRWPARS